MTNVKFEGVLDTRRYTLDERVGKGCWGDVYRAVDNATGEVVAVKVLNPNEIAKQQMQERELTPFNAIAKEGGLSACRHVVPRSFEIDEQGIPFIKMPFYRQTLIDKIEPYNHHLHLGVGLSLEEVLSCMRDIARGLSEMHSIRKQVHSDLKPDNLMIDNEGRVVINDLGSATCTRFNWVQGNGRKYNRGHIYTRSPEGFKDKENLNFSSDIFSFGALAYRLVTGEYPLEEELNNSVDPAKFYEQLGSEGIQRVLDQKIGKNIPRKLRKFFKRCLRYNSYERYSNGEVLASELEKTIESMDVWNSLKRHVRNALIYAALPVGMLALAAYNIETHEPVDLKMPQTKIHGSLYPKQKPEEQIEFESEQINDLPKTSGGFFMGEETKYAKACTDNRVIAYLVKCQWQAQTSTGGMRSPQIYTENQFHDYMAWKHATGNEGIGSDSFPGQPWNIWSKSIEYALTQSKHDGKVDLEDVCAISRVGIDKVDEAKRISKSFDYKTYRDAKHSNGEWVIPRDERRFIDTWLSYFHADID